MDWQPIIYMLIIAISNLLSVYLTARIVQNRDVLPNVRKDIVIEPKDEDEVPDKYEGGIWPKERIYVDEDERLNA